MQTVVALSIPRVPRLSWSAVSRRVYFFIIEYESNIGAVSSYHRVEFVTKFEKLVVAVIVSAVFFAIAILLESAVELFIKILAAIIVVVATAELRIKLDVEDSRRIDPRHEYSSPCH